MDNTEVLWLDDDSPDRVKGFRGLKVITAQSCAEADELLKSGKIKPRWAVVDLIVPQGNWDQPAQRLPGLSFIRHLKQHYGHQIGIVAYSIAMPPELAQKAIGAGAEKAIAKRAVPWSAILEDFSNKL